MAYFAAQVLTACLISTVFSASSVRADESKSVSYAIYAPGQSEKTTSALADLFSKNNPGASISHVKTLPDAIASQADIAVLALSVAEFNALGPYDPDALKKRKVIGIGFGAAKLFGEIGLKIYWGNCAHGMQPRILVQENATIPKEGFDKVFGVNAANPQQQPLHDVEYMPFGICVGYPTIRQELEDVDVIARFNDDRGYAPVVRQGNTILIGFNQHAEDWTDLFRDLIGKVALALNGPVKTQVEIPAVAGASQNIEGDWVNADQGRRGLKRLSITKDSQSWSVKAWGAGGGSSPEIPWEPTHLDRLGDNVAATKMPYGFATWNFGFKVTHLTAHPEKDTLVVELFDIFKDNSGRSNYRTVELFKKDAQSVSDAYPSLKRVPSFFAWDYADEPEPGKRIWLRVDAKTFIERYPSGKENQFRILGPVTVQQVDGILVQIFDGNLQVFIPYLAAETREAEQPQPAAQGIDHLQLGMRADDKSDWKIMGDMHHVD